jgi:hypothetical protein
MIRSDQARLTGSIQAFEGVVVPDSHSGGVFQPAGKTGVPFEGLDGQRVLIGTSGFIARIAGFDACDDS